MALIECPNCKKLISDKATKCPKCGHPLTTEAEGLICEECGQPLEENMETCPNCGCPVPHIADNCSPNKEQAETGSDVEEPVKKDKGEKLSPSQEDTPNIKENSAKSKKVVIAIVAVALLAAVAIYFGTAKMRAYSHAEKEYDAGNYEIAQNEFQALADYKDSATRVNDCIYQMAEIDLSGGKYQSAYDKYSSITDHLDSAEKCNECLYQLASEAFSAGEYDSAKKQFDSVPGYKDADDKAKECVYLSAENDYENEAYEAAKGKYESISDYKDSADKVTDCEFQLSIDGQFLRELSKGLVERWDQNESDTADGSIYSNEPKCHENYCSIELAHIERFENESFNDETLAEYAKSYINLVRDAKEATTYYTVDYTKYSTDWDKIYSKRTQLLQKIVNEYNLSVDEKHQETLDGLMRDASASAKLDSAKEAILKMTEKFEISITSDNYGYKEYSLHMENTTEFTFDYFFVDISLLDEDGNIVDTGSASSVNNWTPGQGADVDAWINNNRDPSDYTITFVPHYSTADGTIYE